MKKLILSLILGIFLSVSHLGAQEVLVPVSPNDTMVQTIRVKFDKPRTSTLQVKNVAESLTEEHINRIVSSVEERSSVSQEMSVIQGEMLKTLNNLLEEENFLQNKIIYQAERHYDLSESEVKRSLRTSQWIDMSAYIAMLLFFFVAANKVRGRANFATGIIELDKMIVITISFIAEVFTVWFIAKPLVSIIVNRDFEIIKFLLQGA